MGCTAFVQGDQQRSGFCLALLTLSDFLSGFRKEGAAKKLRCAPCLICSTIHCPVLSEPQRTCRLRPAGSGARWQEQGSGGGGFEPGFNPGSNSRPSGGGGGGGGGGEQQHREPGFNLGSTWVQPRLNLGSTQVQPRFNLGSTQVQNPGQNPGSTWVQPGFNPGSIFFSELSEQMRSTFLVFGL